MEFHENPANGLVAEARSQTGEGSVSSYSTAQNTMSLTKTYVRLHLKCLSVVSDFNQNRKVSTNFGKLHFFFFNILLTVHLNIFIS